MAAILAETLVILCFFFTKIPYLWFNLIGCVAVVAFGLIIAELLNDKVKVEAKQ